MKTDKSAIDLGAPASGSAPTGALSANRAAVLTRPGVIEMQERAIPGLGANDVLVEVAVVGVCGSDVHYFTHGRVGHYVVREPLVLGHEVSGVIVDVGSEVTTRKVDDRVAIEPGVPCGRCRECRSGHYNLCSRVSFLATPPVDGAFAKYIAIHEDFAHPLPMSLSDEAGALIEPLSVAIWACRRGRVSAGDRVLVTGAGPIGLLAMQAAHAFGAGSTEVMEKNPHRLERALRTGASRALGDGDEPGEADVLIECSGSPTALAVGIEALRPGGTAVIVGMSPGLTQEVPLATVQNRELWLTGTFRYANTYPTAIAAAQTDAVDLEGLITDRFSLEETQLALESAQNPTTVKAVVRP